MYKRLFTRSRLAERRIYVLFLGVLLVMGLAAPHFLTGQNLTTILKGMCLGMPAAIGMTLVMICGQLDLTIGTNITLGAMLTVGLQPSLGWGGSLAVALLCCGIIGLINGLLVVKAKVDSFIVTLGMMIVTQGLILIYCKGGSLFTPEFTLGTWMEQPLLPLLTPRVLIVLLLVAAADWMMRRTRAGRSLYLIGGNATTAWQSGLPVERTLIGVFCLSGLLASLGGALFGISINSAMPSLGVNSLMEVIAAVIIGGTAMAGGRGRVLHSLIALLTLTMLYNGLECLGAGWEIRKIAGGLVLAAVVLYDAALAARQRRLRGRRHELLQETGAAADNRQETEDNIDSLEEGEETEADMKQNTTIIALATVGVVACVAIVAIFAMYFLQSRPAPVPVQGITTTTATTTGAAVDYEKQVAALKSRDGQPLVLPPTNKPIPPRPANPELLPETDAGHWYDMEYSGWGVTKLPQPKPPADGARGKTVVFLQFIDHPYLSAMVRGMQKIADVYGINLKCKVANNDINLQNQQVDQVINERPDLVLISPVDAKACTRQVKKLYDAKIPVIGVNLLPAPEAHQYILAWTGPDDWHQFRLLAHEFAKQMHNTGDYVVVQHYPGGSPFFSRTWSMVTELKKIAPKMRCLEMQTTNLDSEKTKDVVSGWLTRYGKELKGIVSADDSGAQIGINEAVKNARREDIIRVAAGNSKVGMDFVKAGALQAITYQSPEADGAIPMKLAADWLNGKPIPPIRYLPIHIITKTDVEQFMPAQW